MGIVEYVTQGCVVLAPLTKGGNLPFRRLCCEVFGADVTLSEMAYARYIVKGESRERALLRRHPSEKCFGVQLAALQVEEALEAAKIAQDMGADFIDINCGCPINDVVRRGLGAALLRRPKALFRLVEHLATHLSIPVSVKIRTGFSEDTLNVLEIAQGVEAAGAQVLTIHGRTREQRYSKSADWPLIGEVAQQIKIPVVGNGDILTWYEAEARKAVSGIRSVMIGRGALIKPWLFKEIAERRTIQFSGADRVDMLWTFTEFLKSHFGNDELGHRRIMKFLLWHLELFARYQYLPEEQYQLQSLQHPLLQTRLLLQPDLSDPLEKVLGSEVAEIHHQLALVLLETSTKESVLDKFRQIGADLSLTPRPVSEHEMSATYVEYREVSG